MSNDHQSPLPTLNPALHHFDRKWFGSLDMLREQEPTADGWRVLIVACSETGYRPDVNSLFEVGEALVIQNFGNVVAFEEGTNRQETEATGLLRRKSVRHVIVCGHLRCRTIGHFLEDGDRDQVWLNHGDKLREFMQSHYKTLSAKETQEVATQEHVLHQLEREIQSLELAEMDAHVYGWVLDDESGHVSRYNPETGQFDS